jgi:hypothetical protein
MKSIVTGLVFSFIFCLSAQSQTFSENDFKSLQSLVGLWKMETSRGPLFEEWQLPAGNKFTGRSYKVKNTDTIVLERTELFLQGSKIIFSPVVTNQNQGQPVQFVLISNSDNRYTFENKAHDYPQRVIYRFVAKDSIYARIEGTKNGKTMGSDFVYSRVK